MTKHERSRLPVPTRPKDVPPPDSHSPSSASGPPTQLIQVVIQNGNSWAPQQLTADYLADLRERAPEAYAALIEERRIQNDQIPRIVTLNEKNADRSFSLAEKGLEERSALRRRGQWFTGATTLGLVATAIVACVHQLWWPAGASVVMLGIVAIANLFKERAASHEPPA
jgi:hypothetical protein